MEEDGIGRPSTYAPTITTITGRGYVARDGKALYPTELGTIVTELMEEHFSDIVDVEFTANMEGQLDQIEGGGKKWKEIIGEFYHPFSKTLADAEEAIGKIDVQDEVSDVVCDQCGRLMVIKYGPHGKFLACPGFPECRNTQTYFEKIGVACPKCGKDIVIRKTKKGRRYYGCIDNPECDFMTWQRPSAERCPSCGGMLLQKGNKLVCMNESCGFVTDAAERSDNS
jgi:DNA topoisomerase-1